MVSQDKINCYLTLYKQKIADLGSRPLWVFNNSQVVTESQGQKGPLEDLQSSSLATSKHVAHTGKMTCLRSHIFDATVQPKLRAQNLKIVRPLGPSFKFKWLVFGDQSVHRGSQSELHHTR